MMDIYRQGTTDGTEDVSMCNIMSGNGDFIYLPGDGTIYVSHASISVQALMAIAIITVYLAIILANGLDHVLRSSDTIENPITNQVRTIENPITNQVRVSTFHTQLLVYTKLDDPSGVTCPRPVITKSSSSSETC